MNPKFCTSGNQDKSLTCLMDSFLQHQKNAQTAQQNQRRMYYNQYYAHHMPYAGKYMPAQNKGMQQPYQSKLIDIKIEKITFQLHQQGLNSNYTIMSDNQELIFRIGIGQRTFIILAVDRGIQKDQKDDYELGTYNSQIMQQQKLKLEIKVEDGDDVELNLNDFTITILTRQQIKQTKAPETGKKQGIGLSQEFLNGRQVQIVIKLNREWFHRFKTMQQTKQTMDQIFRQLNLPKFRIVQEDYKYVQMDSVQSSSINQPSQQIKQQISSTTVSFSQQNFEKQVQKIEQLKQEKPQEEDQDEPNITLNEKDLNLFPLVTEEFIQKQKEILEKSKKNSSFDDKIKRLFDEVRIKQFKQTQYNQDKKQYKCPSQKCSKTFGKPYQLKNHIKKSHQKLSEIDFTVDDNGEFKFNEKALDYCLLLWKIYPNFVKSVINDMRQRKDQPI